MKLVLGLAMLLSRCPALHEEVEENWDPIRLGLSYIDLTPACDLPLQASSLGKNRLGPCVKMMGFPAAPLWNNPAPTKRHIPSAQGCANHPVTNYNGSGGFPLNVESALKGALFCDQGRLPSGQFLLACWFAVCWRAW